MPLKKRILITAMVLARTLGLFALARRLTAPQLRILGYHGIALIDEDGFRPGLFMSRETFAKRMTHLQRARYPVMSLSAALDKLREGRLESGTTAITIDDGWYGTYAYQLPLLKAHGFPATLYIASFYFDKQTPVFDVALSYVFWKLKIESVPAGIVDQLCGDQSSVETLDTQTARTRINAYAETLNDAAARQSLLEQICRELGFDYALFTQQRLIGFMTRAEAIEAGTQGIDIQLHTHRHRFPDTPTEFNAARDEIDANRRALEGIARAPLEHFCYPSGVYSQASIAHLEKLGVTSATTTHPGFNDANTSHFELKRFLDSELVSDIEFEAEMSGFLELIRRTGYRI